MVEVQKLGFLRFLLCVRDALRGSCVSARPRYGPVRIFAVQARPFAEIVHDMHRGGLFIWGGKSEILSCEAYRSLCV